MRKTEIPWVDLLVVVLRMSPVQAQLADWMVIVAGII